MNQSSVPTTNGAVISSSSSMEEFRAGVTATLRSWSALRAAVASGWGGVQSQEKAEALRDYLYEVFDGTCFPPKMDPLDLEDNLAIYLDEEFSVVLEDGSERQVTELLWLMYEQCYRGDGTLARQAVETARHSEAASSAFPIQVQSPAEDDDDDDDDEMDTNDSSGASMEGSLAAQEYAAGLLFGVATTRPAAPSKPARQLGEAAPVQAPVQIDDDGFAPIQTKRRNRK